MPSGASEREDEEDNVIPSQHKKVVPETERRRLLAKFLWLPPAREDGARRGQRVTDKMMDTAKHTRGNGGNTWP